MCRVNVVIESPKGSAQKYNYDEQTHLFRLKKILPAGMVFPYDFGFISGTKGDDGDPLDVIVISEFVSFPGCLMVCRIIGGIMAEQSKEKGNDQMIRNDRFLAIPDYPGIFENITTLSHLPENITTQLQEFFTQYNKMEGKTFRSLKKMEAGEAGKLITN